MQKITPSQHHKVRWNLRKNSKNNSELVWTRPGGVERAPSNSEDLHQYSVRCDQANPLNDGALGHSVAEIPHDARLPQKQTVCVPNMICVTSLEPHAHVCRWKMPCTVRDTTRTDKTVKKCACDKMYCLHPPLRSRHSLMSIREI